MHIKFPSNLLTASTLAFTLLAPGAWAELTRPQITAITQATNKTGNCGRGRKNEEILKGCVTDLKKLTALTTVSRWEIADYLTKHVAWFEEVPNGETKEGVKKWRVDETGVRHEGTLNKAAQDNWDRFRNCVNGDKSPTVCAHEIGAVGGRGNHGLEELTKGQWQIRITNSQRVTFTVDDAGKVVHVLAVGGHT